MAFTREVTGSLQVKNNIFYVVLNLYDEKGRRKPKWVSTGLPVRGNKRRAEEVLKQLRSEYSMKAAAPKGTDLDFLAYLQSWLDVKRASIQETTYEGYCDLVHGKITRHFEPLALKLQDVEESDIEQFFQFLYESGLSSNTVIHYYAVLMTFFKYARKKKVIMVNPMDDVDKPTEIEYSAAFYSAKEIMDMLEAVKDDVLYTAIVLTSFYGLRRSETLGIRWNAIDFEQKTITINHKVYQTRANKDRAEVKTSNRMKTKSSLRTFPLIPFVEEALLEAKKRQQEYRSVFKGSYCKKHLEYVCVRPDGEIIKPDYVSSHFPYLLKKHELRVIRFHDLRHTCASLLVAMGIPMKMIQEWLGHSVFQTTANRYSHLATDAKNMVADTLAEKLTRNGAGTPLIEA